jgi:pimeloyl-ACP methyl ester carboxylesterase
VAHVNATELLPNNESNILVMHGTDDEVIPIHCGQALANELDTDLVSIPNASHMILLEQPQVVAEHVLAFLKKQQQ